MLHIIYYSIPTMSADEHSAAYSPTATAVRRAAPGCPGRGISQPRLQLYNRCVDIMYNVNNNAIARAARGVRQSR